MDQPYRESRPILPRNLTYVVAVVLMATVAFMAFSVYFLNVEMPSWSIPVTAILFIIVIAALLVIRMDVEVDGESVRIVHAFRTVTVPMGDIIDSRHGDLTAIRSYGGWNLKGVRHRTYSRIGDEEGVAMKLVGKRVVVFSTSDPERVSAMLPKDGQAADGREA